MFVRIVALMLFFNDFLLVPFCFTIVVAVISTISLVEEPLFNGSIIQFYDICKNIFPFILVSVIFLVSQVQSSSVQGLLTRSIVFVMLIFLTCAQMTFVLKRISTISQKVRSFIGSEVSIKGVILSREGEDSYLFQSGRESLGNVLLKIPQFTVIQPGNMCNISGTLVEPESFKDFDYKRYLFRKGVYSILEVKKYECSESGNLVLSLRSNIEGVINKNLPEPESSLLAGIIFGSERVFTKEFTNALQKSGLSHIISASGYNVALLASVIDTLFKKGNTKVLCILKILLIWMFSMLAGLSSSIIRASTMSTIYFFSVLLGRDISKGVLILFCITILIVINPFIIHDIGFLLSSSATVGLIFFPKCFGIKNKWIKENLLPTVTCTLFTLPVVISFFKKVSIISILSNIVAAPIVQSTILWGILANIFKPIYFFVYIQLNIFRYIVEISSRVDLIYIQGDVRVFAYFFLVLLVIFCIYRYPIQNENYYIKKASQIFRHSI